MPPDESLGRSTRPSSEVAVRQTDRTYTLTIQTLSPVQGHLSTGCAHPHAYATFVIGRFGDSVITVSFFIFFNSFLIMGECRRQRFFIVPLNIHGWYKRNYRHNTLPLRQSRVHGCANRPQLSQGIPGFSAYISIETAEILIRTTVDALRFALPLPSGASVVLTAPGRLA